MILIIVKYITWLALAGFQIAIVNQSCRNAVEYIGIQRWTIKIAIEYSCGIIYVQKMRKIMSE